MYEWLYDFIGDHVGFADPAAVAKDLRRRLQEGLGPHPEITVVQFATFTTRGGFIVPEFWHITNSPELTPEGEYIRTDRFVASERLLGVHLIGQATPENVRQFLQDRAAAFSPFWFHQGFNLAVFNTVTEAVRRAFEALQGGGLVGPPQTLGDWERYAKLWVLTYGAYFEAFGNPGERYVGGGADVLSIPWPDDV
jgi:hypothetical protein